MPQIKYYGSHQDYASGAGHQGVVDLKNAHAYATAPSETPRRRGQEPDKKGGPGAKAGKFWMTVFDAQRQKEHVFALDSEGERDEWLDVLLQTIDNYEVLFLCQLLCGGWWCLLLVMASGNSIDAPDGIVPWFCTHHAQTYTHTCTSGNLLFLRDFCSCAIRLVLLTIELYGAARSRCLLLHRSPIYAICDVCVHLY